MPIAMTNNNPFSDRMSVQSLLKRDINNTALTVLFILCPLLSLPWLIKKSYNGEKYSQLLLSLFIGLICILAWPPHSDLYRHYVVYYEIKGKPWEYAMKYYFKGDFGLLACQYIANGLGISFEIVRLMITSVSYYLMFKIYNRIIKIGINQNHKLICFSILFLSVPFIYILRGLRYGFAMMLLSYYILKRFLLSYKNKSDFIILILAAIMHFGSLWLVVLCLSNRIIPNNIPKILLVIIMSIAIMISFYAADLIQLLPIADVIGQRAIEMYSVGGAAKNHLIGLNIFGLITEKSIEIINYIYIVLAIFLIPYNKQTKILFSIIIFWAFTISLFEVNRRVGIPIYIVGGGYMIIFLWGREFILKSIAFIMIILSIFIGLSFWRLYLHSNILYILYPLPISICTQYDLNWLNQNVDSGTGTMTIYK